VVAGHARPEHGPAERGQPPLVAGEVVVEAAHDSDGNTLAYDSEDTARAMLMDAEFVAFDGMDEADAAERGFLLAELVPPRGDDDDALRAGMVQTVGGRA